MALGFILCFIVRISFIYMILSHILKLVGSLTSSYTLHWVLYLGLSVSWVSYIRPLFSFTVKNLKFPYLHS